ncbi:MAG: AAA family ATPase [Halioglobus sp.]
MSDAAQALEAHLQRELGKRVMGLEDVIHALTIALMARGHVLLDGPPGLGKTRLSKAFAMLLGGSFKRVQGTADLMPTDITGVHVFNSQTQTFEFQRGPLFADVVLVDEINRAGPKTQSALLEAMEERQVSIERESFQLSEEFIVIATRNPQEYEGTFPLPESQLDRFVLSIPLGYLSREDELEVLKTFSLPETSMQEPALEALPQSMVLQARAAVADIHVSDELLHYVLNIVAGTRNSGAIALGLSHRGALALLRAARIEAALRGAEFVVPDDVKRVTPWVIPHRVRLTPEAAIDGVNSTQAIDHVINQVPVPK